MVPVEYAPTTKQHRHREHVRHERTMLQQAFYIVQSHDALYDSANEDDDDYVQADLRMFLVLILSLWLTSFTRRTKTQDLGTHHGTAARVGAQAVAGR